MCSICYAEMQFAQIVAQQRQPDFTGNWKISKFNYVVISVRVINMNAI